MARNIPSTASAQAITNRVRVADRLRRLRTDVVDDLARSIATRGLLHPNTVCKRGRDGGCILVGHGTIAAVILDGADRATLFRGMEVRS